LAQAAIQAETLGFNSVWTADRIIIPWKIATAYPYSSDQQFIVPPDRPFLEPLACLAFLAGQTQRIDLGMSVLVLPYRHPLYWAKIAVTIDRLSKGRLVMGIGVGWMEEEFKALGVAFRERGGIADEQLRILQELWVEERCSFAGRHYQFEDVAFAPKPVHGKIPIWVGGEGRRAQRRAGEFGDAWFPYFVNIRPGELSSRFENVRLWAVRAKRDPDLMSLNCCLPIELTEKAVPYQDGSLIGNCEQIRIALKAYERAGVRHLALQFMVPHWPERRGQIELFAKEVLPSFRNPADASQ
jgi:probable F420-dependent oxidoreductase